MTSWAQVSQCWKVDDGDDFDAKALELYFPAAKDHEGAEARKAIWKSMDNNNNKYVSLAEYDGWFNQSGSRRPTSVPSLQYDSSPGMMDVGGFFLIFEAVRTAFDGRCSAQAHGPIGDEGGLQAGRR